MSEISRRHFFFGTLLAGVVPRAGFGSVASLKALGYQSPGEKLNMLHATRTVMCLSRARPDISA